MLYAVHYILHTEGRARGPGLAGALRAVPLSKAPRGNARGAIGSKNPPAYRNPCFFSLLGMVPTTPVTRSKTPLLLCRCLVGRCLSALRGRRAAALRAYYYYYYDYDYDDDYHY